MKRDAVVNDENKRVTLYLNDPYLIKMNKELTRLQAILFAPIMVFDEDLGEYKMAVKPLIENANEIVSGVQKRIYEYTKSEYHDLF